MFRAGHSDQLDHVRSGFMVQTNYGVATNDDAFVFGEPAQNRCRRLRFVWLGYEVASTE